MSKSSLASASRARSGPDLYRLVHKAYAAHRGGDLAKADRLYRAALALEPEDFDVLAAPAGRQPPSAPLLRQAAFGDWRAVLVHLARRLGEAAAGLVRV